MVAIVTHKRYARSIGHCYHDNTLQAQFIVSLLEVFAQWNVPLENIGVIVLYRSQVGMIKNKLTDCKQ